MQTEEEDSEESLDDAVDFFSTDWAIEIFLIPFHQDCTVLTVALVRPGHSNQGRGRARVAYEFPCNTPEV